MWTELKERLVVYLEPAILMGISAYFLLATLLDKTLHLLQSGGLFGSTGGLKDAWFARLWLHLDPPPPPPMAPHLAALSGVILDLGPGTGAHLRHIRPEAVTRIYGIEPCVGLHAELARSAELAGLRGKYTIVAAGVEEALRGSVVGDAEVDAVLAVRVLCCVRDLEQTASGLWRVLRPGGRLVFFEHVRAAGAAGWLQHLYNVLWPHMLGCRLDARTDEVLVRGLEWTSVDVWEERDGVMPWVWGKAVK